MRRRFHTRRSESEACEGAEPREAEQPENRTKRAEVRAQAAKPAASKSSVLQSIYGENRMLSLHMSMVSMMTCLCLN